MAVKGNAVVGQSGGPTAVINQSLVGVIQAVQQTAGGTIDRLLGACNGVRGIKEGRFIDLKGLAADKLEAVAQTPAAALGSSRDKPDADYCKAIFDSFAKNNVRYFFYIGGNDSADAARIVSDLAIEAKYPLHVFHVPKTIDNDLKVTDHCPGYGSAAKFVASAIAGDDRDNASLPGIKVDVIMGRNAGWLTAAATLARQDKTDGPHLIYLPEAAMPMAKFVDEVAEVYGRLGRCLIAVSEGIVNENGKLWGELGEKDAHGNVQLSGSGSLGDFLAGQVKTLVAAKLGGKKLRVRADTFGYLQRSFAGYASAIDQREARQVGVKAVEYAMSGQGSGSVAMRRTGGGPGQPAGSTYGVEFFRAELKDVARDTKPLLKEFINAQGNGVTEAFRQYALPLIDTLPVIGKLV